MVNNSSAEHVKKQMVWIMTGCFLWVTYFNFQGFFQGIFHYFKVLPSWWLLVIIPLFGMAIIWSIHKDELEIKEAEASWMESQRRILEIERQFRLIKSNFDKMSSLQFTYYCADLLRALGYQQVEFMSLANTLKVVDPLGKECVVSCVHGLEEINEMTSKIENLTRFMQELEFPQGLLMTSSDLTEQTQSFAMQHHIKCYNGIAISKLVWLAIEEYKEKAQS